VYALSQQEWDDDALADRFRHRTVALGASLEPSARVDEQRVAARRLNDDCVGLPHVEYGNA
jgi:hypothetical protein